MCLLMLALPGQRITDEHLITAWEANPDGGGFAFIDRESNTIETRKYDDPFAFIAEYGRHFETHGNDSPFLVHVRIATHGSVDLSNVHPFPLDEHTVLGHNGMIKCIMPDGDEDKRSDTRVFIDEYLRRLPAGWLDDEYLTDLVEEYLTGSKMVALTVDPDLRYEWYILRERSGHWNADDYPVDLGRVDKDGEPILYGGVWFSNRSYEPKPVKTPALGYRSSRKGSGLWQTPAEAFGSKGTESGSIINAASATVLAAMLSSGDDVDGDGVTYMIDPVTGEVVVKCDLCWDACDHDGVCFDCEWCSTCDNDLWKCPHSRDRDVLDHYLAEADLKPDDVIDELWSSGGYYDTDIDGIAEAMGVDPAKVILDITDDVPTIDDVDDTATVLVGDPDPDHDAESSPSVTIDQF